MCAEGARTDAEDMVADLEFADGRADCFNLSGQLAAEDPPLRSEESAEEANEEGRGWRKPQSARSTVVAWIGTSTSLSLGVGRSISSSRRTSAGPYFAYTTALIGSPSFLGSLRTSSPRT